jgi:alpha-L-rhamnosidase
MRPTRRGLLLGSGAAIAGPLAASPAATPVTDWTPRPIDLAPARWIWIPCARVLPNTFVLFRKQFRLDAVPSTAPAWITADSRYRLTVNGRRVQVGPAPCDPRQLDVDPADLAPHLRAGDNVIAVEVLFYGTGDGTWAAGQPGFLFSLDPPGARIVSDASWLSLVDRAHPPGMYKRWYLRALQEQFDAREHPYGWDLPSYSPGPEWLPAALLDCPADKPAACQRTRMWSGDTISSADREKSALRVRQIPACVEREIPALKLAHSERVVWQRHPDDWFQMRIPNSFRIDPAPAARPLGPGEWELPATPDSGATLTLELDEQVVGYPYFTIDAPAGTTVELMTQESHDPAKTRWLDTHHYSWSRYICRDGVNRFEASDYESFRWMQLHVHGASHPVRISRAGVRRKLYDWPRQPHIVCSEPALQRLFDASVNTLRNSAIETLVDGMGRERQQYSGDGGHQLQAVRYAFGETRICRRYLRTFSEGLTPGGYFMDCWPAWDRLARVSQKQIDGAYWGPLLDHGVGFVFDCWNHYLETGERDALVEPQPRLFRFAEYLESIVETSGLLPVENLGIPTVWIDHQAYKQPRHKQCAFNLYTAAMFEHALAPIADLFRQPDRAAHFRAVGRRVLSAARERFWSAEQGAFVDNLPWLSAEKELRQSDRALATSILFDQCPGNNTAAALRGLADLPRHVGLSYPCNAGWRYWALAKGGRGDVVVGDLRRRWATMASVRLNNTLQEFWTATPDSGQQWSHCALAPLFVLYMDIAGIRPTAPGFARCRIRPQLGDLPDLDLTAWTVRGPIRFTAKRDGSGHRVTLSLPAGCDADVVTSARRFGLGGGKSETFLVAGERR